MNKGQQFWTEINDEVANLYKKCRKMECLKSVIRIEDPSEHLYLRGLRKTIDSVWFIQKDRL